MLEKNREDQLDRSYEKRSVTNSRKRGISYNKQRAAN
jgi:hypothetical protein